MNHNPTDNLLTVPARLRWMRRQLGWSQQQLGEAIGGDKHTIKRLEAGADLSLDKAKRICRALRVDLHWLAYGAPGQAYAVSTFGMELALFALERVQHHHLPTLHREADLHWAGARQNTFDSDPPADPLIAALHEAMHAGRR